MDTKTTVSIRELRKIIGDQTRIKRLETYDSKKGGRLPFRSRASLPVKNAKILFLEGPPGAGKTCILDELSNLFKAANTPYLRLKLIDKDVLEEGRRGRSVRYDRAIHTAVHEANRQDKRTLLTDYLASFTPQETLSDVLDREGWIGFRAAAVRTKRFLLNGVSWILGFGGTYAFASSELFPINLTSPLDQLLAIALALFIGYFISWMVSYFEFGDTSKVEKNFIEHVTGQVEELFPSFEQPPSPGSVQQRYLDRLLKRPEDDISLCITLCELNRRYDSDAAFLLIDADSLKHHDLLDSVFDQLIKSYKSAEKNFDQRGSAVYVIATASRWAAYEEELGEDLRADGIELFEVPVLRHSSLTDSKESTSSEASKFIHQIVKKLAECGHSDLSFALQNSVNQTFRDSSQTLGQFIQCGETSHITSSYIGDAAVRAIASCAFIASREGVLKGRNSRESFELLVDDVYYSHIASRLFSSTPEINSALLFLFSLKCFDRNVLQMAGFNHTYQWRNLWNEAKAHPGASTINGWCYVDDAHWELIISSAPLKDYETYYKKLIESIASLENEEIRNNPNQIISCLYALYAFSLGVRLGTHGSRRKGTSQANLERFPSVGEWASAVPAARVPHALFVCHRIISTQKFAGPKVISEDFFSQIKVLKEELETRLDPLAHHHFQTAAGRGAALTSSLDTYSDELNSLRAAIPDYSSAFELWRKGYEALLTRLWNNGDKNAYVRNAKKLCDSFIIQLDRPDLPDFQFIQCAANLLRHLSFRTEKKSKDINREIPAEFWQFDVPAEVWRSLFEILEKTSRANVRYFLLRIHDQRNQLPSGCGEILLEYFLKSWTGKGRRRGGYLAYWLTLVLARSAAIRVLALGSGAPGVGSMSASELISRCEELVTIYWKPEELDQQALNFAEKTWLRVVLAEQRALKAVLTINRSIYNCDNDSKVDQILDAYSEVLVADDQISGINLTALCGFAIKNRLKTTVSLEGCSRNLIDYALFATIEIKLRKNEQRGKRSETQADVRTFRGIEFSNPKDPVKSFDASNLLAADEYILDLNETIKSLSTGLNELLDLLIRSAYGSGQERLLFSIAALFIRTGILLLAKCQALGLEPPEYRIIEDQLHDFICSLSCLTVNRTVRLNFNRAASQIKIKRNEDFSEDVEIKGKPFDAYLDLLGRRLNEYVVEDGIAVGDMLYISCPQSSDSEPIFSASVQGKATIDIDFATEDGRRGLAPSCLGPGVKGVDAKKQDFNAQQFLAQSRVSSDGPIRGSVTILSTSKSVSSKNVQFVTRGLDCLFPVPGTWAKDRRLQIEMGGSGSQLILFVKPEIKGQLLDGKGVFTKRATSLLGLWRIALVDSAQAEDVFRAIKKHDNIISSDVDLAIQFELAQIRRLLNAYFENLRLVGIHPSGSVLFKHPFPGMDLIKDRTFKSLFKKIVGRNAVLLTNEQINQIDLQSGVAISLGDYVQSIPMLASTVPIKVLEALKSPPHGLPIGGEVFETGAAETPPFYTLLCVADETYINVFCGLAFKAGVAQKKKSRKKKSRKKNPRHELESIDGKAIFVFEKKGHSFIARPKRVTDSKGNGARYRIEKEYFFSNGVVLWAKAVAPPPR